MGRSWMRWTVLTGQPDMMVVVFTCSTNPKQSYSKVRDSFYTHHISGEKEIYDLTARADLDGYIIPADYFLIRNLWESFCGSSRSRWEFPPLSTEKYAKQCGQ